MSAFDEDEDDAWSYSFPPSTESLPLKRKELDKLVIPNSTVELIRRRAEAADDDVQSQISTNSSHNGLLKAMTTATMTQQSRTSSHSSTSLQSPFILKAAPAVAQTTKEDASSIISKDKNFDDPPSKRTSFVNTMKEIYSDEKDKPANSPLAENSPKFISYRKSKSRSLSGNLKLGDELPTALSPPDSPKYDRNLYTDETFADTPYRYAVMKRNTDFHQLFRSLDLTDRLLDDFSCALSREILLQGRLYVSEHYICFNLSLLGWVTNIVLHVDEIVRFEKKLTAGLFPNGILVETKDTKYTFASLISRDLTFDFMKAVWERNRDVNNIPEVEKKPTNEANQQATNDTDEADSPDPQTPKIQNYLMSLDGDDNVDEQVTELGPKVVKFKEGSKYRNMGPDSHVPTRATLKKEFNEVPLCSEIIDAPVGVVFDILFGTTNTLFHKRFIESQNGSELSEYEEFHPKEEDPTSLERNFTYKRALGYSIGPKSTKCELSEVIEHLNFADHIVVTTSTRTPDVPLGNAFLVKTKYLFTWAEDSKTKLDMSYFIEWTGKSWIKAVIEKQSLSGQKQATEDLLKMLRQELDDVTYMVSGGLVVEKDNSNEEVVEEIKPISPFETTEDKSENSFRTVSWTTVFGVVFMVATMMLQLNLYFAIHESNELAKSLLAISSHLFKVLDGDVRKTSVPSPEHQQKLATIVKEYERLTKSQKREFLVYQLENK